MIWRLIFNGVYSVSDQGGLRRVAPWCNRQRYSRGLAFEVSHGGYFRVVLHVRGKRIKRFVHRLITEAFLGPVPPGHCVNHLNGDKQDNRLTNLEYVTFSGNNQHASALGLIAHGERHGMALLTEVQVRQIRRLLAFGESCFDIAKSFGVSRFAVSDIKRGKSWRHSA